MPRATTRKADPGKAIIERMGKKIDMGLLGDLILKEAGGEEEIAKMIMGSLKSDKTSAGAKAGTFRLLMDILNQKRETGDDIGEIPPAERLEAIMLMYMGDYVDKKLEEMNGDAKHVPGPIETGPVEPGGGEAVGDVAHADRPEYKS